MLVLIGFILLMVGYWTLFCYCDLFSNDFDFKNIDLNKRKISKIKSFGSIKKLSHPYYITCGGEKLPLIVERSISSEKKKGKDEEDQSILIEQVVTFRFPLEMISKLPFCYMTYRGRSIAYLSSSCNCPSSSSFSQSYFHSFSLFSGSHQVAFQLLAHWWLTYSS